MMSPNAAGRARWQGAGEWGGGGGVAGRVGEDRGRAGREEGQGRGRGQAFADEERRVGGVVIFIVINSYIYYLVINSYM
jgi:hypothetical protein